MALTNHEKIKEAVQMMSEDEMKKALPELIKTLVTLDYLILEGRSILWHHNKQKI